MLQSQTENDFRRKETVGKNVLSEIKTSSPKVYLNVSVISADVGCLKVSQVRIEKGRLISTPLVFTWNISILFRINWSKSCVSMKRVRREWFIYIYINIYFYIFFNKLSAALSVDDVYLSYFESRDTGIGGCVSEPISQCEIMQGKEVRKTMQQQTKRRGIEQSRVRVSWRQNWHPDRHFWNQQFLSH